MLAHMGFGTRILDGYMCTSCRVWVCAEEGIVIMLPATAATASLVRHFCQDVSVESDPFTKVFRSWWILAKGRSAAGVMRSVTASRSRRTVSRLMSTGLALIGKDPPDWPLDCGDCCDGKRFRVVTADGIWVGNLKRLVTNYYNAYSEGCAPDKELLQVASLIGSEWVRRFLRLCLNNPEQTIAVMADQRKAARVALAVLCPATVPPSSVSSTPVCTAPFSVRVRAMLSELWDLPTCSVSLAKELLAATTNLRQWLATPRAANRNGPVANPPAGGAPVPAAAVSPPAVGAGDGGGAQAQPAVLPQIPFGAGVVPVVPTKSIDGWLPPTRALPDNMAQGLLWLINEIVVDPAVSPLKPQHVKQLRHLATILRSPSAAADIGSLTSAAATDAEAVVPPEMNFSVVVLLQEVTMLLVFSTSACLLGARLPVVARGVTNSLDDVCATVETYQADRMPEIGSAAASRGGGRVSARRPRRCAPSSFRCSRMRRKTRC